MQGVARVYKWVRVNKFISIIGVGLITSIGIFVALMAQFIKILNII